MNAKFDALEKLKENNWQEEEKKRKKVVRKIKAKVRCIKTEIATVGLQVASYRMSRYVKVIKKENISAKEARALVKCDVAGYTKNSLIFASETNSRRRNQNQQQSYCCKEQNSGNETSNESQDGRGQGKAESRETTPRGLCATTFCPKSPFCRLIVVTLTSAHSNNSNKLPDVLNLGKEMRRY